MAWFVGEVILTGLLLVGGAAAARPWFAQLNIAWITTAQDEQTAAMLRLAVALLVFVIAIAAELVRTPRRNVPAPV
jgi:NADH:ubiquinone oxidoreductase subunit H